MFVNINSPRFIYYMIWEYHKGQNYLPEYFCLKKDSQKVNDDNLWIFQFHLNLIFNNSLISLFMSNSSYNLEIKAAPLT